MVSPGLHGMVLCKPDQFFLIHCALQQQNQRCLEPLRVTELVEIVSSLEHTQPFSFCGTVRCQDGYTGRVQVQFLHGSCNKSHHWPLELGDNWPIHSTRLLSLDKALTSIFGYHPFPVNIHQNSFSNSDSRNLLVLHINDRCKCFQRRGEVIQFYKTQSNINTTLSLLVTKGDSG